MRVRAGFLGREYVPGARPVEADGTPLRPTRTLGEPPFLLAIPKGASVIKCCYAATGMYMTAAAAILRE